MPEEGAAEAQEATTTTAEVTTERPEPQTFDADYVRQLRAEAAKNRKEAQEAKARAQEYEDRDKTETEKLSGKVTTLNDENKSLKGENLRLRVALDKSLSADLVDRLRGNTQEELEADAEKLLALVNNKPEPTPEFDGGARETAPTPKTPEQEHNEVFLRALGLAN